VYLRRVGVVRLCGDRRGEKPPPPSRTPAKNGRVRLFFFLFFYSGRRPSSPVRYTWAETRAERNIQYWAFCDFGNGLFYFCEFGLLGHISSGATHFGQPKCPRASVCIAWRTRKWSRVHLRLGLAPAGRCIFGAGENSKSGVQIEG
jgi:hypothetical protein